MRARPHFCADFTSSVYTARFSVGWFGCVVALGTKGWFDGGGGGADFLFLCVGGSRNVEPPSSLLLFPRLSWPIWQKIRSVFVRKGREREGGREQQQQLFAVVIGGWLLLMEWMAAVVCVANYYTSLDLWWESEKGYVVCCHCYDRPATSHFIVCLFGGRREGGPPFSRNMPKGHLFPPSLSAHAMRKGERTQPPTPTERTNAKTFKVSRAW